MFIDVDQSVYNVYITTVYIRDCWENWGL